MRVLGFNGKVEKSDLEASYAGMITSCCEDLERVLKIDYKKTINENVMGILGWYPTLTKESLVALDDQLSKSLYVINFLNGFMTYSRVLILEFGKTLFYNMEEGRFLNLINSLTYIDTRSKVSKSELAELGGKIDIKRMSRGNEFLLDRLIYLIICLDSIGRNKYIVFCTSMIKSQMDLFLGTDRLQESEF